MLEGYVTGKMFMNEFVYTYWLNTLDGGPQY